MNTTSETSDFLVFSPMRWNHIYQRPHHILSRYAKKRRVFYVEDPQFGMTDLARLHVKETPENVLVVVPYLPSHIDPLKIKLAMQSLLDELLYEEEILDYSILYYSPRSYSYSDHLSPRHIIFEYLEDHPMTEQTKELMEKADLVLTAGFSLLKENKFQHPNIHAIPSSLDYKHFSQGRLKLIEPDDQINLSHPRIGFYGTIDGYFNFDLLMSSADLRPEYQFIIAGPVKDLDPEQLPKRHNIHYLGKKDYHALPLYLAGWDCTILPLVVNELSKHLAPMKILEYLAAGKPIVSTSLQNLVHTLKETELVHFADTPKHFVEAIDVALNHPDRQTWLEKVDQYLSDKSWDQTFFKILDLENNISKINQSHGHAHIIRPVSLPTSGVN